MQIPCRIHENPMRNPCRIHAGSMQNQRNIHAESTQKTMHNSCSSDADHTRIRVLLFAALAPRLDEEHVSLKALELLLPSRLATCLAACLVRRLLRSGVATQIWRLRASHMQCLQQSRSLLLPQLAHEGGDECQVPPALHSEALLSTPAMKNGFAYLLSPLAVAICA